MRIIVINNTTLATAQQVADYIAAQQIQLTRDFAPEWGIQAVIAIGTIANVMPTDYVLHLVDTDNSEPGALGWHIEQADRPYGIVPLKLSIDAGDSWQATASHEIIEMLGDPYINLCVEGTFHGKPALYAYELCDAVENDEYDINGVKMSNFLFPAWFVQDTPKGDRIDFLGKLPSPFALDSGGYISYCTKLGHWQQIQGDELPAHQAVPHKLSRRHRRINQHV